MGKYFIDTEFLEGAQNKTFLGMNIGKTKPTIDLISIGIVSEEVKYAGGIDPISKDEKVQVNQYPVSREYYAISKDFNLKEAWNRFDIKNDFGKPQGLGDKKVYWLRDNVLKPIWKELYEKEYNVSLEGLNEIDLSNVPEWSYKTLKRLINKYGKTNKQIAEEIMIFVANRGDNKTYKYVLENEYLRDKPEFYAYYADYDWVAFCWLFGKMIDLPNGFPMYCKDLKQIYDEKQAAYKGETISISGVNKGNSMLPNPVKPEIIKITELKKAPNYPKQTNEHNALDDAKWNYQLYKFLKQLL